MACSFDGTTRKIYVNGVVIGSDTPGVHTVPNTNFRIGSTNNGEYFSGGIDEVRIWNRGLPQAEIINNMNCELAAGQTGLIAYYQFNQGFDNSNNSTITTLTDSTVNTNTGTLNNFALTGTTSNWVAPGGVTTGTVCVAAAPLAIVASQTNVSCNGGSNGTASVVVSGGYAPYTYSWSPSGGTSATASGLVAGTYICTITDASANSTTQNFTITQPTAPVLGTTVVTNISCNGGTNGTINLTPSGGTGPYTFNWGGGITTEDRTGLAAGTYSVTITDLNGCTGTVSGISVTQPISIVSGTAIVTNVACNGGSNGTIDLTSTGGTAPHTYLWNDGITTEDRYAGLASGTYSVIITDNNGCTNTVSGITITQPTAISLTPASQINIACNGGSNGAVTVNAATGGTPGYTYDWTPGTPTGDGTTSVTGLGIGTWTCIVTDANGCTTSVNFTVTEPSAIDNNVTLTSGILEASQTGATYQWYQCPNTILTGETNQTYIPTIIGDYKVEITLGGCTNTSACVTVSVLGNESFDTNEFSYYPNPVIDNLNITYNKNILSVQIFDLTGRMVKSIQPNSENVSINLTDLSTAMYIAKVKCEDNSQTEIKIFKK